MRALAIAIALLLAVSAPLAAAGPAAPVYGQYQADQAAEAQLSAQLAAADAAVVRARGELSVQQAAAAAAQAKVVDLNAQVAALNQRLASEQSRTDSVVRFLYEDGSASFLAVLLQSTSFSDFLTRFSLVVQIVASEVGVLHTVAAQRAEVAQARGDAATAATQAAAAEQRAADGLTTLRKDEAARAATLAAAKAQASASAAKLVALDQTLLQGLPQLNGVLAGWSALPWGRVQPASVSVDVAAGHVAVTVSAADLTAAVGIAPLALTVAADGVSLTSGGPADLQLTGPVTVQGGDLVWQPATLTVGGAPAGPGVVASLLAGRRLLIPVPAPAPGLSLQTVRLQAGSLELDFGL